MSEVTVFIPATGPYNILLELLPLRSLNEDFYIQARLLQGCVLEYTPGTGRVLKGQVRTFQKSDLCLMRKLLKGFSKVEVEAVSMSEERVKAFLFVTNSTKLEKVKDEFRSRLGEPEPGFFESPTGLSYRVEINNNAVYVEDSDGND